MAQPQQKTATPTAIIVIVVLAVIAGVYFLSSNRGGNETRLERAAEDISEGVENASEELRDRSTGEKIGDAIEDAGRDIQDAARNAKH